MTTDRADSTDYSLDCENTRNSENNAKMDIAGQYQDVRSHRKHRKGYCDAISS